MDRNALEQAIFDLLITAEDSELGILSDGFMHELHRLFRLEARCDDEASYVRADPLCQVPHSDRIFSQAVGNNKSVAELFICLANQPERALYFLAEMQAIYQTAYVFLHCLA